MTLPVECELQGGELVFWELAQAADLDDEERVFDHTCFIACTNGLRPMGNPTVHRHPYPELAAGESCGEPRIST